MSSREEKLPTLEASTHAHWKPLMGLRATTLSPDVAKLFQYGTLRADVVPVLPTRQDRHIEALGGQLRYPNNIKGDY
jgi:hypothetical protein